MTKFRIMVLTEDGKNICYRDNIDPEVIDDEIGEISIDIESTYPDCIDYWIEPTGLEDTIGFVDDHEDDLTEDELYDLLGDVD